MKIMHIYLKVIRNHKIFDSLQETPLHRGGIIMRTYMNRGEAGDSYQC